MRRPHKARAPARLAPAPRAPAIARPAGPCLGLALALASASPAPAQTIADPPAAPAEAAQTWAVHGQATFVDQGTLAFHSPYRGPNSLDPGARGRETADVTLYVGFRPWAGAEVWANPEEDQGFGLSNTLGVAGFPSGEAYKVGKSTPYGKLPRLFLRQTIDLGGAREAVDADLNQLAGSHTADRLVVTIGKFGVPDIFDTDSFAHDPRHDFLNWSVIDNGTFDYAADAWGYTYGAAVEWYVGRWTLRTGVFDLSTIPNTTSLERDFSEFQLITELEERHKIAGRAGKLEITGFVSRGRMGNYSDAIRLAEATGQPARIAAVRRYQGRPGISFNLEQDVTDDLGVFAHGGVDDGTKESYEFSDIDRTLAVGASLKGCRWARPGDTVGLALVANGISQVHEAFLSAGGLGILVGDGKLPHPGTETILETYYQLPVQRVAQVSLDYQFVNNPGYNRDRGPVSIFAVRLHAQF
jgi:high affinity Mn2+ porin